MIASRFGDEETLCLNWIFTYDTAVGQLKVSKALSRTRRFFATAEAVSLVAIMILAFDVSTPSGDWIEPSVNTAMFTSAILPPKDEVPVLLKRRSDYSNAKWRLDLSEEKGRWKLASG